MERALPAGTVTFLFTDVEGSTQLLHSLGEERYADALAEHRRILRAAFGARGGVEVDTQGDAFFIAFPTAPAALAAAAAATEELARGPIRVRMGLHSGTPLLTDEGYVGVDVHRAARIAACGHGGQILLSTATAGLVDPVDLHDLGEHRLKDLSAPDPSNVFNLFGLIPYDPVSLPLLGGFLVIGAWPLLMGLTQWLQMLPNNSTWPRRPSNRTTATRSDILRSAMPSSAI